MVIGRRPNPMRWLIVVALGVGLLVFAWRWLDGGVVDEQVVRAAVPTTWTQTTREPEATERSDGTYEYACPEGMAPATRIDGGGSYVRVPSFPNPEQLPEFVACFERRDEQPEVVETRIKPPGVEDVLIGLGAGIVAYFVGVGFVLSRRALMAPPAQE